MVGIYLTKNNFNSKNYVLKLLLKRPLKWSSWILVYPKEDSF